MKILYIGESWNGSSARALRESLETRAGVIMDDIGEDLYVPTSAYFLPKAAYKFLRPLQRRELISAAKKRVELFRPDVMVVYKGRNVDAEFVRSIRRSGVLTVNVFPDCSPHAHGALLHEAVGEYELIISTKSYHPPNWSTVYGYANSCSFVPHGYEPKVHLWSE